MDKLPPKPSAWLVEFYKRFSYRYMTRDVRLAGFRPRWIAFRRDEIVHGIERAVLDVNTSELPLAHEATLMAQALALAGDRPLVVADLAVKRSLHEDPASGTEVVIDVMSIALWESDQSCGVLGFIELDGQGRPTGQARGPMPLPSL